MRILYATDGRVQARYAGRLIASMFDPRRVEVDVMTVVPERKPDWEHVDRYEEERLDIPPFGGDEIARAAADALDAEGFTTTFSSVAGGSAEELLKAAGGHDAIVLGGAHTSWLGNALLGSTSMHVLHHAPCSVVIVHDPPEGHNVVIGVDGSAGAEDAVQVASDLLDPERCRITLASSVPHEALLLVPPYFGGYATNANVTEKRERERIQIARKVVRAASGRLAREGFDVDDAVLVGSAGPELLKEVDNIAASLLVVGSRGNGPFRRAILGSVSDQVVRHAPATLIARPSHS